MGTRSKGPKYRPDAVTMTFQYHRKGQPARVSKLARRVRRQFTHATAWGLKMRNYIAEDLSYQAAKKKRTTGAQKRKAGKGLHR